MHMLRIKAPSHRAVIIIYDDTAHPTHYSDMLKRSPSIYHSKIINKKTAATTNNRALLSEIIISTVIIIIAKVPLLLGYYQFYYYSVG